VEGLVTWTAAFGRFWYEFIIGDDWSVAAAIAVGLIITGLLHARGVPAWWLIPPLAVAALGVSLRRAHR
jgi:hypothetical protein